MEARQLADFLIAHAAKQNFDTVLSYEQLSKVAGCDLRVKRGIVQTARNICLREANAWFATVWREGIKLATPHEASAEGESGRLSIVRTATRSLRKMAVVKYEALDESQKVTHNLNASILGAVRLMNNRSSRKKIEGAVAQASEKIPTKSLFRLFHVTNGET
jgi:hypothetical protein